MKKIVILAALPLVISTAFAGVCNNGSLIGAYSVDISGSRSGNSGGVIGQAFFNGTGTVSFTGIRFENGVDATNISGNGQYSIISSCVGQSSINLTNGETSYQTITLDTMDNIPAVRIAYHAKLFSAVPGTYVSGDLTRVVGKF